MRNHVQHRDEQVLLEPFSATSSPVPKSPASKTILDCARPYLPPDGALGEMVLNVGKAVYLAQERRWTESSTSAPSPA